MHVNLNIARNHPSQSQSKSDFIYILVEIIKTFLKYIIGKLIDATAEILYNAVMNEEVDEAGPVEGGGTAEDGQAA